MVILPAGPGRILMGCISSKVMVMLLPSSDMDDSVTSFKIS